jgi:hypothetical protein
MSENDFLSRLQEFRDDLDHIAHFRAFPLLLETILISTLHIAAFFMVFTVAY